MTGWLPWDENPVTSSSNMTELCMSQWVKPCGLIIMIISINGNSWKFSPCLYRIAVWGHLVFYSFGIAWKFFSTNVRTQKFSVSMAIWTQIQRFNALDCWIQTVSSQRGNTFSTQLLCRLASKTLANDDLIRINIDINRINIENQWTPSGTPSSQGRHRKLSHKHPKRWGPERFVSETSVLS